MRVAPVIELDPETRKRLESIVRTRKRPFRQIERCRIVLLAADGLQNKEIAIVLNVTPEKVARWRVRFLELGLAGLEHDAPRGGRKRTITARVHREVVRKTVQEPPPNGSHWSTRSMAAAARISEASVRRIWQAHGLKPHERDQSVAAS